MGIGDDFRLRIIEDFKIHESRKVLTNTTKDIDYSEVFRNDENVYTFTIFGNHVSVIGNMRDGDKLYFVKCAFSRKSLKFY